MDNPYLKFSTQTKIFNILKEQSVPSRSSSNLNTEKIYNHIKTAMQADSKLETKIFSELLKCISPAYDAVSSDEGYCYKFNLPTTTVLNLFNLLNLDPKIVENQLADDWDVPGNAKMYRDSYYHILLCLILYGLRENKKPIVENCLLILFFKLWNGRKAKWFAYCDKNIMKYVVSHLCTNKHIFSKYDNPFSMIKEYFVPTLLKTYADVLKTNPVKLKYFFSQCWARINGLFAYNFLTDMKTGQKKAQGGILPLYMAAKQQGMSISTLSGNSILSMDGEESSAFDDYSSIHNREEIVNTTCDHITMSVKPSYSQEFIDDLRKTYKVKVDLIQNVLQELHNHRYYEDIRDIVIIILSKTNVQQKHDICIPTYYFEVKRTILSSKNTVDTKKIKTATDNILTNIFATLNLDHSTYSDVYKIRIRAILINGIVYNMKKVNCNTISG